MKDDRVMTASEMLHILRHGEGFCGWGADQHTVNHFGDHVWFQKIPGGYTECCSYGEECPHHAKLKAIEDSGSHDEKLRTHLAAAHGRCAFRRADFLVEPRGLHSDRVTLKLNKTPHVRGFSYLPSVV